MSPLGIIALGGLPGALGSALGAAIDRPGIWQGGLAALVVGAASATAVAVPLRSQQVPDIALRLAIGMLVRLVGAVLVAALFGKGRPDLLITLVAALLAAMAIEIALLMRAAPPKDPRA